MLAEIYGAAATGLACGPRRGKRLRRLGDRIPIERIEDAAVPVDALRCPRCAHAMRIVAAIRSPEAVRAILACLVQSTRPPPVASARLFDDNDHTC